MLNPFFTDRPFDASNRDNTNNDAYVMCTKSDGANSGNHDDLIHIFDRAIDRDALTSLAKQLDLCHVSLSTIMADANLQQYICLVDAEVLRKMFGPRYSFPKSGTVPVVLMLELHKQQIDSHFALHESSRMSVHDFCASVTIANACSLKPPPLSISRCDLSDVNAVRGLILQLHPTTNKREIVRLVASLIVANPDAVLTDARVMEWVRPVIDGCLPLFQIAFGYAWFQYIQSHVMIDLHCVSHFPIFQANPGSLHLNPYLSHMSAGPRHAQCEVVDNIDVDDLLAVLQSITHSSITHHGLMLGGPALYDLICRRRDASSEFVLYVPAAIQDYDRCVREAMHDMGASQQSNSAMSTTIVVVSDELIDDDESRESLYAMYIQEKTRINAHARKSHSSKRKSQSFVQFDDITFEFAGRGRGSVTFDLVDEDDQVVAHVIESAHVKFTIHDFGCSCVRLQHGVDAATMIATHVNPLMRCYYDGKAIYMDASLISHMLTGHHVPIAQQESGNDAQFDAFCADYAMNKARGINLQKYTVINHCGKKREFQPWLIDAAIAATK